MIFTTKDVLHMTKGFIRYETKNGVEYASVYKARRVGSKKTNDVEYLGRVIGKEKGVYKNRERGMFTFSLEKGFAKQQHAANERLILDFGDSYLLDEVIKGAGLKALIEKAFPGVSDTVLALLFYRVLSSGGSNCYTHTWWEGAYARILFPEASVQSQRVSEALQRLGDEACQRRFFQQYLRYISPK